MKYVVGRGTGDSRLRGNDGGVLRVWRTGRGPVRAIPAPSRRIPPPITSFPRRRESGCAVLRSLPRCVILRRLPRRPRAEERRACGDEQAAG